MPHPPPPPGNRRRPYLIVAAVVLAAALVGGASTAYIIQRWQTTERTPTPGMDSAGQPGVSTARDVRLFYVASDGRGLVERRVALAQGGDALSRARAIAERQLGDAPAPLVAPFPAGTSLRSLYLAPDGNAFVDLSLDAAEGHSGGSLDELFTVYALVNALAINLPEVLAVQILIDGAEVDTLAGHIDLRQPLAPSLKWVLDPSIGLRPDATEPASEVGRARGQG